MTESHASRPGQVSYVTIGPDEGDQRIDNFLCTRLKGVPKTRIYRLLRRGEVRVNRGRVRPGYRLQAGDEVRIPPVIQASAKRAAPGGRLAAALAAAILYEDESLLVLDKPAGMPVHGGTGYHAGVIEGLRALRPEARFLELVHRLDRDTSGVLLVAKKRSQLRHLHAELRQGRFAKEYQLLCRGRWVGGPRQVVRPLLKNRLQSGERVVVAGEGRPAETWFEPLVVYNGADRSCSLVKARPVTGRTHQIRVHAAEAGHPIAGDAKYGDREFNRLMKQSGLSRMFLHAARLGWRGVDGEFFEVSAPLPASLQKVLEGLDEQCEREEQDACRT